jgi:TetR/AcrR family transcriptional regulator, transcriptional repressor for nem operon
MDLAEELVQTRGFHGFSYADIADELGITRAALHYHFRGKTELGAALTDRYHRRFAARLDEIGATTSYPARLAQYADIYRSVFANGRMCLCGMMAAEFDTLDEPMRQSLLAFFDTNYRWLGDVLTAGRRAGELRFSGDAGEAAELLVSTLEGAMLLNRPSGNTQRFDAVVAQLLSQFT